MAGETRGGDPEVRQVPVVWVDHNDGEARWVNQFTSVFQPDEFVVSLGQVVPPAILGDSDQERRERLNELSFVPINTIARVAMNRARLVQLIDVLQQNLASHDEAVDNLGSP